jgi:hypothetical protein
MYDAQLGVSAPDVSVMTVINPTDEFLRYAADCERTAKVTRDPAARRLGSGWPIDGFNVLNDRSAQPWEQPTKCHYGDVPFLIGLISNRTLNPPRQAKNL